ncbi:MAG: SGNH/GDSL hydrolase family protein [Butyrivibrio sp.]|nr:SGNH/GDSL hydrolase family protein [Butyrivibrio sp.]
MSKKRRNEPEDDLIDLDEVDLDEEDEDTAYRDEDINLDEEEDDLDDEADEDGHYKKKSIDLANLPIWVHGIIIGIILLIFAASAWALYRWNTGTKITFSKTDDISQYEVERLDNVFYLTAEDLEGHEDDGVNTILCLGNDSFTYNSGESGLAQQIAEKTDSVVYNAGFPSSCVSVRNVVYDSSYPLDMFSFYNITKDIVSGDFSGALEAAGTMEDSTYYQSVDLLQNLDMSTVDMLVIMYDAQDYLNQRAGRDFNDADNPITFMGAYHAGIKAIREAYPYIRIVVMSPTMCYAYTSEGQIVCGDTYDFGNGALPTYLQHIIDTCEELGVTFVDNYYGTVDVDNSDDLLLDNIHMNEECISIIANHFAQLIFNK